MINVNHFLHHFTLDFSLLIYFYLNNFNTIYFGHRLSLPQFFQDPPYLPTINFLPSLCSMIFNSYFPYPLFSIIPYFKLRNGNFQTIGIQNTEGMIRTLLKEKTAYHAIVEMRVDILCIQLTAEWAPGSLCNHRSWQALIETPKKTGWLDSLNRWVPGSTERFCLNISVKSN